jgi:hypothetical protein
VDWIQILSRLIKDRADGYVRPKIGVIVSAWDLLSDRDQLAGPSEFLRHQYPLLADFIAANERSLNICVFGISLFGGDPKQNPRFKETCLETDDPCAGGFVVYHRNGELVRESDLTIPIEWALREVSTE